MIETSPMLLRTMMLTLLLAAFSHAHGQQLPKSGTISWHTGWKAVPEAMTTADKAMQGHGTTIGISFNDTGSGPLHQGPAECVFTFLAIDGKGRNKGYCAFGDPDGDRIFTDWDGTAAPGKDDAGVNNIVGGTGKYAGMQGSGPWTCKPASQNGALMCRQSLNYRLP
jgi:hypothetical protein